MSLSYPYVLVALLLLPLLYRFLSPKEQRRKVQSLIISMMFALIALSKPYLTSTLKEVEYEATEIIIAIDLSASMQATDIAPSRLAYIKKELLELFATPLKDKIALVGFTSSAIILSPLTSDMPLLKSVVENLRSEHIISKSTQIMPLLELSKALSLIEHPNILLLSDGGEGTFSQAKAWCHEEKSSIYSVGVATKKGTVLYGKDGDVVKDALANIVVTALNPELESLSKACEGDYFSYETSLRDVITHIDKKSLDRFKASEKEYANVELFYLFVTLSSLFFLVATTSLIRFIPLFALMIISMPVSTHAGIIDFYYLEKARVAYEKGDYPNALHHYGLLDQSRWQLLFNEANTLYRLGRYSDALALYVQIKTQDKSIKAKVLFNMGNCYARQYLYTKARNAYIESLRLLEDRQTMENLMAIIDLKDEKERPDHHQDESMPSDDKESKASAKGKEKDAKEGSSQMQSGESKQGSGATKMKSKKEQASSQNAPKSQGLSSRQYELINEGAMNEKSPW